MFTALLGVLQEKEVDIYISLFSTILGFVLSLFFSGQKSTIQNNNHINFITINNYNTEVLQSPSSYNQESAKAALILLGILSITYLFFRIEILNLFFYLSIFIVSFWSYNSLVNFFRGIFTGWRWLINIIFYIVFFGTIFIIINQALTPSIAPKNFQFSQQLIHQYGIMGLMDYFSLIDLEWFALHYTGIIFLFYAMLRIIFASTYYTVMGRYLLSEQNYPEPWLAKKTRKHANLWKNIILIPILLLISYYCVSGEAFQWYKQELPQEFNLLINRIFHGTQKIY